MGASFWEIGVGIDLCKEVKDVLLHLLREGVTFYMFNYALVQQGFHRQPEQAIIAKNEYEKRRELSKRIT